MPPKKGQAKGGKGDGWGEWTYKGGYKGEEKGDRKGNGKARKGGGGGGGKGGKNGGWEGSGKRGGRGGGKSNAGWDYDDYGDADDWKQEGDAGGYGLQEGRSQLSSSAPDFKPSGIGFGGMYGSAEMQRLWGWQSPEGGMPVMPPLWREYADENGVAYYYNSKTGLSQWERPPELDPPKPPPPPEGSGNADKGKEGASGPRREGGRGDAEREREEPRRSGGEGGGRDREGGRDRDREGGGGRGGGGRGGKRRSGGKPDDSAKKGGGQKEGSEFGPPGCNLFVFHLPDDWTDDDLHEYFAPHGNVVSAKVMKELGTGRSRGFGFVSYEDRVSAATAVKKMQGYKILGKRLKVEFKKGEQESNKCEIDDRGDRSEDEEGGGSKKSYPDDERLIGYLRAISAKNVVQSLKESESSRPPEDAAQVEEGEEGGGNFGDD